MKTRPVEQKLAVWGGGGQTTCRTIYLTDTLNGTSSTRTLLL